MSQKNNVDNNDANNNDSDSDNDIDMESAISKLMMCLIRSWCCNTINWSNWSCSILYTASLF